MHLSIMITNKHVHITQNSKTYCMHIFSLLAPFNSNLPCKSSILCMWNANEVFSHVKVTLKDQKQNDHAAGESGADSIFLYFDYLNQHPHVCTGGQLPIFWSSSACPVG